jgi:hypothetical protein
MNKSPEDAYSVIGYFIAAAVLFPVGLWIKATYAAPLAAWIRTFY